MNKLILKCEIITPLLMHGADGKTPELREQSFKGVMRFWFRSIHGNLSLEELREKEAEIFGDTKRKSSFRIKIVNKILNIDDFNPLPHKSSNFKIKGFKPKQTFEIEFLGENLEIVKNIFILSTILGGFGQRSRRGFGSIKVKSINNKTFDFNFSKDTIIKLIKKINPKFTMNDNSENFKNRRKFPYIKSIYVGNKTSSYDILLKKIGLATHKFSCFGSANPRLASPIYITVNKDNNEYFPIITSLNGKGCWKNFNDFKKGIL